MESFIDKIMILFGIPVSDILFSLGLILALYGEFLLTEKNKNGWLLSIIEGLLYGVGVILVGYSVFGVVDLLLVGFFIVAYFRWNTTNSEVKIKYDNISLIWLSTLFIVSSILSLYLREDSLRTWYEIIVMIFVFCGLYLQQQKNRIGWLCFVVVHIAAGILFYYDKEWILFIGKILFLSLALRGWYTWRTPEPGKSLES